MIQSTLFSEAPIAEEERPPQQSEQPEEKEMEKPEHTQDEEYRYSIGSDGEIIDINLSELSPYPENSKIFKGTEKEEWETFKVSMKERGQLEPIEITPNRIIITGHRRWRAAQELGWNTIRARVRYDLDSPQKVRDRWVESNLHRRGFSKGEKARAICLLFKKAGEQRGGDRSKPAESADLETPPRTLESIGHMFGLRERQARTYLKLGKAPRRLQDLVDDRESQVTLELASRYASKNFPQESRAKIDEILEEEGVLDEETLTDLLEHKADRRRNFTRGSRASPTPYQDEEKETKKAEEIEANKKDAPSSESDQEPTTKSKESSDSEDSDESKDLFPELTTAQALELLDLPEQDLSFLAGCFWELDEEAEAVWSLQKIRLVSVLQALRKHFGAPSVDEPDNWVHLLKKFEGSPELPQEIELGSGYKLVLPIEQIARKWPR